MSIQQSGYDYSSSILSKNIESLQKTISGPGNCAGRFD
jgi:hypothetical protein